MRTTSFFHLSQLAAIGLLGIAFVACSYGQDREAPLPPRPTHANVVYQVGHPQNVLDIWLADSGKQTPLAIYIHGGGYRSGSKDRISPGSLRIFLEAGISVASVEYRFIRHEKLPAAHHDCRRALQFLRSRSAEWNIDKERIGAWGDSAGAQLSMYLAFHDDMADPGSADPIARESTRLTCVATTGGQASIDLDLWVEWVPGYDEHHRDLTEYFVDPGSRGHKAIIADVSAIDLLSKGDPPLFMSYRMRPDDPIPDNPKVALSWKVHHVVFGTRLEEKMDRLGLESHLVYPDTRSVTFRSFQDFFIAKLSR